MTETAEEFRARMRSIAVVHPRPREKRMARDMETYASLRKEGLQPDHIDGCDERAAREQL